MAALGFTPARSQDAFRIEPTGQPSSFRTSSGLSGEEVRNFYETLTKDDTGKDVARFTGSRTGHGRERRVRRRRVRGAEEVQVRVQGEPAVQRGTSGGGGTGSERSAELLGLRLLRCAHEGDLSGVRDLLSKGADINFQDTFFWTAVMCASWSGQRDAVRLLLQRGAAWVGVVDTQGRDAKDLAMEAGHSDVLEELESFGRRTQRETQSDSSAPQPQWCDVCCSGYSSSLSVHLSSTLHQFSLRRPSPTPYYCLPPSSNSYKMMVRSGWKPGSGLGPEGEGPHQPVPTVLKRDQKGLGYGQMKKAKVTHFQAGDRDAVKPHSRVKEEREGKGLRKDESRRKEQRDKNWERDFRASFYL